VSAPTARRRRLLAASVGAPRADRQADLVERLIYRGQRRLPSVVLLHSYGGRQRRYEIPWGGGPSEA
jgi:hypothetical protein